MLVSGRVCASEKSELIFGFFRTIAEELNKLLVCLTFFCCSKVVIQTQYVGELGRVEWLLSAKPFC